MRSLWNTLWIFAVFTALNANPLSLDSNGTNHNSNGHLNAKNKVAEEEEEITYKCVCDDPIKSCDNNTCISKEKCVAYLVESRIVRTCFYTTESANMYCHSKFNGSRIVCCSGDYCNMHISLAPVSSQTGKKEEKLSQTNLVIIFIAAGFFTCVIIGGFVIWFLHRRAQGKSVQSTQQKGLLEEEISSSHTHHDLVSSGSGSGQPALVQRTAGKDCRLIEQIGQGRFGEVWKCTLKGDIVAVKIFTSLVENSWKKERDIYNMGLLRHDNILGFYASDTTARNSCTVHMIIVHYHHHGSLYDYLKLSDIDIEEMLTLALSAASGINYLHNEIRQGTGTNEKPYIAHRDIKSKNILVKSNGECCIGDFGYAITELPGWEKTIDDLRVGTKRYMAPELLAETLNPKHFRAFLCVDIYAFGLILWEIARRARPFSEEYQMPFWNVVPANPSFEDMKKVVVCKQMRPPISNTWESQPLMVEMEKLIRGCWAQNPSSRLSILRVKLNLSNLRGHTEWSAKTEKMLSRFDGSTTKTNDSLTLNSSSPMIT